MKIGISTACLTKKCETEDAISLVKELGADICEIYLQTFYEYRPEFAAKYSERTAGLVFSVSAMPLNFEPTLFSENRRPRGDGFYWLDQIMRSAQLFGAKNYAFRGSVLKNFDSAAERLSEIAGFCDRYGVNLCIENARGGLYNNPYIFRQLKERCHNISGVLNIRYARESAYPYPMYLRDMSGAISLVKISDVNSDGETCLPGEGVYDFKEIISRLEDVGFNGPMIIETENFGGLEELKRSVEFIRSIIS